MDQGIACMSMDNPRAPIYNIGLPHWGGGGGGGGGGCYVYWIHNG